MLSKSHSRSTSPSSGRSRTRSRSTESSRSRSPSDDRCRLHVADIATGVTKPDLSRFFEKYGPLKEVWLASSPPCFAFIVFKNREDAEEALQYADNSIIGGGRIRVTIARPRTRGRGIKSYDPNQRCYSCGQRGHFSRDCYGLKYGYKRPSRRSPPYRPTPRRFNNLEDFRRFDRKEKDRSGGTRRRR